MAYLDDSGNYIIEASDFLSDKARSVTDRKIQNVTANVRFQDTDQGRASTPQEIAAYRQSLFYPGQTDAEGKKTSAVPTKNARTTGGGGGGTPEGQPDPSSFDNFDDYWDAWSGLDIGAAARAYTAAHPDDPAIAIGHSGDGVRYRGRDLDGITDVGSANQKKVRLFVPSPGGGGGTGGGGNGGTMPTGANNYGLAQFGQNFLPQTKEVDPFQAGTFTAPSTVDDSNDPGFTARLKAAQQALERSASSRGTLLSGGTLKALTRFAQDYASNEYDKVYGRDLATFNANEGERFKGWAANAGLTGDQYGRELQTFLTNSGVYTDAYNRARTNQNDLFGQNYALSSLGLSATNQANSGNNLLTSSALDSIYRNLGIKSGSRNDTANANGSAAINNSNQLNSVLGSLGNNYLNLYLAQQRGY